MGPLCCMMTWFPLLNLDGCGLFYKVLGVSDMVRGSTYQIQRMFTISLATSYMIEPLLDTMGLRGCLFCGFWVSHGIWGWMYKWGKVFYKYPW